MGKQADGRRPWSARRLFAAYAVVTLVPVLALGLFLTQLLRTQADDRGLAEGKTQARLVARATVAPLLDGGAISTLTRSEYARLQSTVRAATKEGQILRLRLRDLTGRIVFPVDNTVDNTAPVDDEALDAAHGETVAELTRLNADERGTDPGPRVVEMYLPLTSAQAMTRIGVLELYLPYDPIAADIAKGQRSIYLALLAGLTLLWLSLIGVTASVIRHLRRETRAHAYLAGHDALTGLPNRARMVQNLDSLLSSSTRPVALAQLTVERFRQVSDALGQTNADAVIKTLARRLRGYTASDQALARLDGGDFAVVAAGDDGADVHDWLLRLRVALREPIEIDGLPLAVDVTIGYDVVENRGGPDAEKLLAHAAVALTAAQQASTSILRYAPTQEQHDATALSLLAEIESAIHADELVLHFQPKYDVALGHVSSVEALVRWQHPTRGLLYPAAFLDAVEETEFIDDLTAWVLRRSCLAAHRLDPAVRVAVNVSARSLVQPGFAADVIAIVRDEDLPPARIILEVTETAVVTDPRRARRTLARLRDSGFAISIDDFGVGQTSLSHLVAMPIDELKIDRTFVGDMIENPRSAAVVRAVIELGHSLGISVTAEGVESEPILTTLHELGCDVAQGYFFSRPVPLDQLLGRLGDAEPDTSRDLVGPRT